MSRHKLAPEQQDEDSVELQACVEAAQKGDTTAMGRIVELTENRLVRFCFHLSGSPFVAEELCQDVYVFAFQGLDSLEDPSRIRAWLFRIARNRYLDFLRRSSSKCEYLITDSQVASEYIAQFPDELRADAELLIQIQEAMNKLRPDERAVLLLVDLERHSLDEAAEILQISEAAVTSRLRRARAAFIKEFQKN